MACTLVCALPSRLQNNDPSVAPLSEASTSSSEQVVLLHHSLHYSDAQSFDSADVRKVAATLNKKEPIVKGILIEKEFGNKFFLIKPQNANKVISLNNLDSSSRLQNRNSKEKSKTNQISEISQSKSNIPHSRQKRFIFKLRNIALPLSIFHYLGFLPMRVPGLPYHVDPGLPDYTKYEPYNELVYPEPALRNRSYRRKKKYKY